MLLHQALHFPGARHCVPLPQVPAHREHQWVGVAGGFGQAQWLVRAEAGTASGRGKNVVGVEAFCCRGWSAAAGIRPLLRSSLRQQFMAQTADVTEASSGQLCVFVVDLCSGVEVELLGVTQAASHLGEHLPVRSAFPVATPIGGAVGHPTLGVGHGSSLFTPLGCRQQQMGVMGRF